MRTADSLQSLAVNEVWMNSLQGSVMAGLVPAIHVFDYAPV